MSEINPIHTPCKQCVFAKYDGITQTDCHLQYISKYRDNDTEILEAYDNEKEFYIINGKKCIGYRENKWFENRGLGDLSIEEKIKEYNSTNYLHYLLFIDLYDYSYENFDNLKEQLVNISIKPSKIVFVRYQNKQPWYPIEMIQDLMSAANLNCKWRVQTMVDDEASYDSVLHSTINLNKKHRFILAIKNHSTDLESVLSLGNKRVYEDLDRFTIISDKNKNITLFSTPSYRFYLTVERKNIFDYSENYVIV